MKNSFVHKIVPKINVVSSLYYLVFAIISYLVIYTIYSPELLYFKLQPFFAFDSSFFEYFKTVHNSKIILASRFILQFLYYPLLGTTIIVLLLIILSVVYSRIFKIPQWQNLRGIEFVPSLLILSSLKAYSTGLETLMIFLQAGIFLLIVRELKIKNVWVRIVLQLAILLFVFFVFDLLATLVVLVFFSLEEIFMTGNRKGYLSLILNALTFSKHPL